MLTQERYKRGRAQLYLEIEIVVQVQSMEIAQGTWIKFSLLLSIFGTALDSFPYGESLCASIGRSLFNTPVKHTPEPTDPPKTIEIDGDNVFAVSPSGEREFVRSLDEKPFGKSVYDRYRQDPRKDYLFSDPLALHRPLEHTEILSYARFRLSNDPISIVALEKELESLTRPISYKEGEFFIDHSLRRMRPEDRPEAIKVLSDLMDISDSTDHALLRHSKQNRDPAFISHEELLEYASQMIDRTSFEFLQGEIPRQLPGNLERKKARSFITYLQSLSEENRLTAIAHLGELVHPNPRNIFIRGFLSMQDRLMEKEIKYFTASYNSVLGQKMLDRLIGPSEGVSPMTLQARRPNEVAAEMALTRTKQYIKGTREMFFLCASPKTGKQKAMVSYYFIAAVIGTRVATAAAFMGYNNRDQAFSRWGKRFAYEVFMKGLAGFGAAWYFTRFSYPLGEKLFKRFNLSRGLDFVSALVFNYIFLNSVLTDEGAERHETTNGVMDWLAQSGAGEEELREVVAAFEEEETFTLFKRELFRILVDNPEQVHFPSDGNLNWEELRGEEMDREEAYDMVWEAVVATLYERDKGWIDLGEGLRGHAQDVYAYDMAIGIPMTPIGYFLDAYIFSHLCNSFSTVREAVSKAMALLFAREVLVNGAYYTGKKKATGL